MTRSLSLTLALSALFVSILACSINIDTGSEVEDPADAPEQAVSEAQDPTATPEPSNTSPPPTARPTRTAVPTQSPFFRDEFERANAADVLSRVWFGDEDYYDYYSENGRLYVDINTDATYVYFYYDQFDYDDVRIDLEVRNEGDFSNFVTLTCRFSVESWYEFNISSDGRYVIYYYSDATRFLPLYDGGSRNINTGLDSNIYSAECVDDELVLIINGIEERRIKDTRLSSGHAGFSVSSLQTSNVNVSFDWIEFSRP